MASVYLKLTSAIAIEGTLAKAGDIVAVSESVAKNLLHREKAILATEEIEAEEVAAEEGQPYPEMKKPKRAKNAVA